MPNICQILLALDFGFTLSPTAAWHTHTPNQAYLCNLAIAVVLCTSSCNFKIL